MGTRSHWRGSSRIAERTNAAGPAIPTLGLMLRLAASGLLCLTALGCCRELRDSEKWGGGKGTLSEVLMRLPSWPEAAEDRRQLSKYVDAAYGLSNMAGADRRWTLLHYLRQEPDSLLPSTTWPRVYVLLRLLYEVPEFLPDPAPYLVSSGARECVRTTGAYPLAWPVEFKPGRPLRVLPWSRVCDIAGFYTPEREFDYFDRHFPLRSSRYLDLVRRSLDGPVPPDPAAQPTTQPTGSP